ncbi:MAG: hypothetical protein JWN01_1109 [Patescibacteria group bacterium]|nr:hypothetical protein [Patescibacteria group bacterium]
MLPHMIYNSRWPYRLEAIPWGAGRQAPPGTRTSGITQPPMLAIAVEKVAHALEPKERQIFIRRMLPVILHFHEWVYRERDPRQTGLPVSLHSWESGMDDTPYWTEAMNQLSKPPLKWRWLREYRRVHSEERATSRDLQHMLTLAYTMKAHQYDSRAIMEHAAVIVQDLVFCSVLAAANESLDRLAEAAGSEVPPDLRRHFAPTRRALEQLWDPQTQQYYSRDYRSGELLRVPTIATFMPLFAGTASLARAGQLRDQLVASGFNTPHPLPSVPTTSRFFEEKRYWRGPIWINMNWFVIVGLERYGFTEEADWLRLRTLGLTDQFGFREYYNPISGEGLGANHFSWSAALTIDLLSRPLPETSATD